MKKLKSKAFTLIELIIVIAVIAILAAIAIPKFMSIRESGLQKSDISTAKSLHTIVVSMVGDGRIEAENLLMDPEVYVIDADSTNATVIEILKQFDSTPEVKSRALKGEGSNFAVAVNKNGNVRIFVVDDSETINTGDVGNRIYPECNINDPNGNGKLF